MSIEELQAIMGPRVAEPYRKLVDGVQSKLIDHLRADIRYSEVSTEQIRYAVRVSQE